MDLFAPHPQLAHHLFYVPLEKDTVDVDANVKPPVRRSQRTKRSSREKRNQTHEFLSSMDMREESSIIEDEFPLFNPADGFGVEQTSAPPVHRVSPQRRTAIMEPQDIHKLSEEFLLQNTILLSVACIGAFVLFIVNFVGIFFCKDYLKRKEGQQVPLGVLGLYPQSLSHSRRCRYHTILRRFSLESGSHSQHESHSGVGSEPPMVGPLTLGPGGIEAGGQSVLNKTESRRHANAFAVLEVPEIIMMSERLGNGVHREEIRIVDNLHTGVGVPGPEPPASGVGGEEGGDGGGKGWRERLRIGRGKKDKELAVNASHLNGTGTLRGGVCSIIKSANGNTAVLPKYSNNYVDSKQKHHSNSNL